MAGSALPGSRIGVWAAGDAEVDAPGWLMEGAEGYRTWMGESGSGVRDADAVSDALVGPRDVGVRIGVAAGDKASGCRLLFPLL